MSQATHHARSRKIASETPGVSAMFRDSGNRGRLEDYLKNTAGIKEPPQDEDILDSFF